MYDVPAGAVRPDNGVADTAVTGKPDKVPCEGVLSTVQVSVTMESISATDKRESRAYAVPGQALINSPDP